MILLAGCGDAPTALTALTWRQGEPFMQGHVERTPTPDSDWGYLLLAPSPPGADPARAYFRVGPEALLVWEDGQPAPEDALQVGRRVSVWLDTRFPILDSAPPQIVVSAVVIHDRAPR